MLVRLVRSFHVSSGLRCYANGAVAAATTYTQPVSSAKYNAQATSTKSSASSPKKFKNKESSKAKQKLLISCKRSEFNQLVPVAGSSKFGSISLASQGWQHYKSKGDHFTIHPTVSEEQIRSEMLKVDEFLAGNRMPLCSELMRNLSIDLDIECLTDIQVRSIPKVYENNHTLIAAETGCGKTLAYLLPIVQRVLELKRGPNKEVNERKLNTPLAIILTPGRELSAQIGSVAKQLGHGTDLKVKTILGGNTKRLMLSPEFEDVDIIVASMGAISKLVTTGIYRIEQVRHVVLDEADTLLDDSFAEKLCHFLKKFPFYKNHMQDGHIVGTQLVLASATMPTNIEERLQRIVDVQTIHEVASTNLHKLMPHIEQRFLRMSKTNRPVKLLYTVKESLARKRPLIVFSNKSATSDYISIFLNDNGINCLNLNGDMLMKIRIGRFEQFQDGHCHVLSTTDIGSRGLDTARARHVINFDFPLHVSDYIHRCGRIGRVCNLQQSLVTNFVSSFRELDVVRRIEHAARTGSILPNVNANIKNLINQRIIKDAKAAGVDLSMPMVHDEAF